MSQRVNLTIRQLILAYRDDSSSTGDYSDSRFWSDLPLKLRLRVDEFEKIPRRLSECVERDSYHTENEASLGLDEIKFAMNWLTNPENHADWCANAYTVEVKRFLGEFGLLEQWIFRVYRYIKGDLNCSSEYIENYYAYAQTLERSMKFFGDLCWFVHSKGVSSSEIAKSLQVGNISVWKFIQEHQEEIEKDGLLVKEPCTHEPENQWRHLTYKSECGRWGIWK